ncbi:MAG: NAD(P)-binding domain-containing protein [Hyphomicrobiaceae bacterium]
MTTIGFIGLGRMGRPMASNLARKGFSLVVHDVNPEPVRVLEELGARSGNGPAGVAQASDIVITMLPASAEVETVVLGSDGVLANARPGALIVDMSTVDPQTTDRLHREAVAKGMRVIDAPVGRVAWHADRGESLFMVGASEADLAEVMPLLQAMGTTIHHCGGVGTGIRTKLVNNYLAIVLCQLNAEALALSQRFGLDLQKSLDVIHGTTATNGQLKINWPNKVLAGDITPGFSIDLAHKDLSLILASANAERVPMPVASAAREVFSLARAKGDGGNDFSSIVDTLCGLAGIEKPRLPKG